MARMREDQIYRAIMARDDLRDLFAAEKSGKPYIPAFRREPPWGGRPDWDRRLAGEDDLRAMAAYMGISVYSFDAMRRQIIRIAENLGYEAHVSADDNMAMIVVQGPPPD